ncbi:MAG: histidine kinase [bacterium]
MLSAFCAVLWVIGLQILYYYFYNKILFQSVISRPVIRQVWFESYPFIAWSVIYLGIKIYEELVIQKQNTQRAIMLAQSAQLEMLRYQINPHFLFNSLNSARTLVQVDPPLAQEMLTLISEFLRYSLSEGSKTTVRLIKEMEAINAYLDIEKIRFKDNLMIDYIIEPQTENLEIPVFLILPLVENAIKHGMKTTTLPLKITVKTKLIDGYLQIDVINSGKWIEPLTGNLETNLGTGTGLKNVQKRLDHSYAGNYNFEIIKEDKLIFVVIKLKISNGV